MNQVLHRWNIPIHPHIRCICVDASPRAAHYTGRGTRTGHGCVPTQTMVLLFLAAPPHCCSAMFRAGRHSAKNTSKYIETRTTLIARSCSPLEKRVQHHSEGMLFPRLSLRANTRVRPNGTWRKGFLSRYDRYQKSVSTKTRGRSRRVFFTEHNLRYHAALRRI